MKAGQHFAFTAVDSPGCWCPRRLFSFFLHRFSRRGGPPTPCAQLKCRRPPSTLLSLSRSGRTNAGAGPDGVLQTSGPLARILCGAFDVSGENKHQVAFETAEKFSVCFDQSEDAGTRPLPQVTVEAPLKCPRCAATFLDFGGWFCAALTCHHFRCGFCACCLAGCGNDVHAHVARCPRNRRNQEAP